MNIVTTATNPQVSQPSADSAEVGGSPTSVFQLLTSPDAGQGCSASPKSPAAQSAFDRIFSKSVSSAADPTSPATTTDSADPKESAANSDRDTSLRPLKPKSGSTSDSAAILASQNARLAPSAPNPIPPDSTASAAGKLPAANSIAPVQSGPCPGVTAAPVLTGPDANRVATTPALPTGLVPTNAATTQPGPSPTPVADQPKPNPTPRSANALTEHSTAAPLLPAPEVAKPVVEMPMSRSPGAPVLTTAPVQGAVKPEEPTAATVTNDSSNSVSEAKATTTSPILPPAATPALEPTAVQLQPSVGQQVQASTQGVPETSPPVPAKPGNTAASQPSPNGDGKPDTLAHVADAEVQQASTVPLLTTAASIASAPIAGGLQDWISSAGLTNPVHSEPTALKSVGIDGLPGVETTGSNSTQTPSAASLAGTIFTHPSSSAPVPISSLPHHVEEMVMQRVSQPDSAGQSSVVLRLDPPELGKLSVHLSVTNDVVSIRMVAADPAAQQALERQLGNLQQSLANHGVSLDQCQVDCSTSGNPSFEQGQPQRSIHQDADSIPLSGRKTSLFAMGSPASPRGRAQLDYVA
jgi:flagellar hook-length control protein FliK